MKNRVIIQDHESIPFHRGRPNIANPTEESSKLKKVDTDSKKESQGVPESKKEEKPGSITFHKREPGLVL